MPWAGKTLVKGCRGILDNAEKRIEQLTETKEGVKAEGVEAKQVMEGEE